jgi:hypothetical protein
MSYVSPFTGNVIQPTDVSFRSFSMSTDVVLSWPINGSATDNYAARIMEVTATTTGLKLYMPPANQTSVGTDALIRNVGGNAFTVVNSSGSTIISIAAGVAQYIYVTNNSTEGGVWGIIAFGTGTSSPDAATLAGFGLVAASSTLNQSHPASVLTPGYTFGGTDRAQTKVWGGGTGTFTLPAAASLGNNWFTIFKNNGTGLGTISTSGSDLIDGAISKLFNPNESAFIICTGSAFVTVGYGVNTTFAFNTLVKPVTTGTVTLTTSEAGNTIQEYVGSLTGNVTVIFPGASNLYVISNQVTPNGYTLTISTGIPGGTNAIIPAGQQATLICDGVNFLNANTIQAGGTSIQLNDGSAASPSLSFGSEPSTGVYRPALGQFGISILGTQIMDVDATGISVTGTGVFSGGVQGGVFT